MPQDREKALQEMRQTLEKILDKPDTFPVLEVLEILAKLNDCTVKEALHRALATELFFMQKLADGNRKTKILIYENEEVHEVFWT